MARINIEEESWVRFYRLAEILNCEVQKCVGTVTLLWHRSQDVIKASGSFEEVIDWCGLAKLSEPEQRLWISSLEKARFISAGKDGQFVINGNQTQIENRISRINRASKGAKALMKKVKEIKALEAGSKPARSRLKAGSKALNAMQGNAEQSNAIQDSADQGNAEQVSFPAEAGVFENPSPSKKSRKTKAPKVVPPELALNREIWASYEQAYQDRYHGQSPVRNKTVNSMIAKIGEKLGAEAPAVVRFFVQHPKTLYVQNLHPLSLCLRDAEALRTQWALDHAVTDRDVKNYQKNQDEAEIDRLIREGKI